MSRPLCRYCGKPISKWTETVWVHAEPPKTSYYDEYVGKEIPIHVGDHVVGRAENLAELKRLTNRQIVSVSYVDETDSNFEKTGKRHVRSFTTWDGVTYMDDYFCSSQCAQGLGRLMAKEGRCTTLYNEARKKELANG